MSEKEILDKLKDVFGYDYSYNTFNSCEEIVTLDDFFKNAQSVNSEKEMFDVSIHDEITTYREFIDYLSDKAVGDIKSIVESFNLNYRNKFIGYVKVDKTILDGKIILQFKHGDVSYKAKWQPLDNYGVWQTCGIAGDDYSGYLLFPTFKDDEYFCLWYRC